MFGVINFCVCARFTSLLLKTWCIMIEHGGTTWCAVVPSKQSEAAKEYNKT